MSLFLKAGALVLVGCCVACAGGAVVVREPVTLVRTRTAGVTFVIVRPASKERQSGVQQPGDGSAVMPESDYMLICDARGTTGMVCAIPAEAALARYSYTPNGAPAPTNIDEGVGTLADVTIARDSTTSDPSDARPAATAAPAPTQPTVTPETAPVMAPSPPPSSQAVTQ